MKAWPLLALLLAAPAAAEDEFRIPDGLRANIGGKAPVQDDASARLRASHAAIQNAGLKVDELIATGDKKPGWSVDNVRDLGPAIGAASKAVCELHARHPSAVADAYGNGTMTNMEDTAKLFGGGNLERGCISHQTATFDAVKPVLAGSSLSVSKIRYGLPPLQHNAVVVFPHGTDWMYTGVVFDGWLRQKCAPEKMTYMYAPWGPIRPIWGVHVEPRYWKANVKLLADGE